MATLTDIAIDTKVTVVQDSILYSNFGARGNSSICVGQPFAL